jgi:Uma2 family endonuclease
MITAAELERLTPPGKQTELLQGRLVVREPPGTWHGAVSARLTTRIGSFVERNGLGLVLGQDTGFKIASDPDTVRAPDVAFVARERSDSIPDRGYAALAPDLLVEIVSPDDRPGEVLGKVGDWLEAGTRLIGVVDPQRQEARVYRADGSVSILARQDELDGEDVLPGFRCALKDILARR